MSNDLHVIFGTGQIGTLLGERLLAKGVRVRLVARHPRALAGAETMAGDARDLAFAAAAGKDAAVVYDTMNPPYQHWRRELLDVGRGSLRAAIANHAKLVALDCLYMYDGKTKMSETTPIHPVSKKGEVRKQLAELRLAAEAPVAIARASDFFGPALTSSWFGERFFARAFAGKVTECLGDPDQRHSYTYAADVAAALDQLGASDATGVWHVPTLPAVTTRELVNQLGHALDLPIAIAPMSPALLRMLGLVLPFMRELPEMRYQWEAPFELDDAKFRARFAATPTPLAEQLAATAAWANRTYRATSKQAA